jgi:hypothetical protein
MLVTDRTREALRCRRIRRKFAADGFEEIGESGGHLWELHRDIKRDHNTITAVAIAPEGKTLFVKAEKKMMTTDPGELLQKASALGMRRGAT